jgi:hypothetical protein
MAAFLSLLALPLSTLKLGFWKNNSISIYCNPRASEKKMCKNFLSQKMSNFFVKIRGGSYSVFRALGEND